jgi:phospholipid/cholesterol/gamma-HCH transport system permease protein
MSVTEEIDAMRTLGIAPLDMLVLCRRFIALVIAMPLLTVFADVLGVFGGMIMARRSWRRLRRVSRTASSRRSASPRI